MNHKVHLFANGCLTLKLSLSWKTVTCSLSTFGFLFSSPTGEIGMVDRSTWALESVAVAMFAVGFDVNWEWKGVMKLVGYMSLTVEGR